MAKTQQIAEWVGGVAGAGLRDSAFAGEELTCVASPEAAGRNAIVFATSAEALTQAIASAASLILANERLSGEATDPRIILVPDARLAFAVAAAKLSARSVEGVHPSATVSDSAQVANTANIGAGAVIGAGVRVGENCEIGARVVLEDGVVLGDRVRVQSGAVLGSLGFGYARSPDGTYVLFPQQGTLVVEDDVEIGANTTIDRGALGETRIGAGTKIDNLVHIGHNCRIGKNVIIAAQTGISGSSVVEEGAILGGQVGMGEHALVGPGVILGGGAGVLSGKKLRGPGEVFWGRPARPLKQYLRDLARLSRGR